MTYDEYVTEMVRRGFTSYDQVQADSIVLALKEFGFSLEESYKRAMEALKREQEPCN